RHRRRRGARPAGDLEVRQSLVQELRDLPAVRHRVQLRPRAEVAEEALHLVRLPERGDRPEELPMLLRRPMSWYCCRRCHRVTILTRWHASSQFSPPSTSSTERPCASSAVTTTGSRSTPAIRSSWSGVRLGPPHRSSTSSLSPRRATAARRWRWRRRSCRPLQRCPYSSAAASAPRPTQKRSCAPGSR